jgi:hypothetical protein
MGRILQHLAAFHNHGAEMSPLRVERCRWNQMKARDMKWPGNWTSQWTGHTPEGWPIHPTLKTGWANTREPTLTAQWVHTEQNQAEQTIEVWTANAMEVLLWPGGTNFTGPAKKILGKSPSEDLNGGERILAFMAFQEAFEEALEPGCLAPLKKLKGTTKLAGIKFLLTGLPEGKEEQKKCLENRGQFLERNPLLVQWIWGIPRGGTWPLWGHSPISGPSEGPNLKKPEKFQSLQDLVDEGETDKKIMEELLPETKELQNTKETTLLAELIQGDKESKKAATKFLNQRRKTIQSILEAIKELPPAERTQAAGEIRKSTSRLAATIKEIQNDPKRKMSRCRSMGTGSLLLSEAPEEDWRQTLQALKRTDQFSQFVLEWESRATEKALTKKLTAQEAKKNPENQHAVLIPDITHIRDYLEATYPFPADLPTKLAPEKLVENIRKWEQRDQGAIQASLKAADIPIDPTILTVFPQTITGEGFKGEILRSQHAFERESERQKHCVRGYFRAASTGNCAIYSINHQNKRWTLQLDRNLHIVQLKGWRNEKAPDELKTLVRKELVRRKRDLSRESFMPPHLSKEEIDKIKLVSAQRKESAVELFQSQAEMETLLEQAPPEIAKRISQEKDQPGKLAANINGKAGIVDIGRDPPEITYWLAHPKPNMITEIWEVDENRKLNIGQLGNTKIEIRSERETKTLQIIENNVKTGTKIEQKVPYKNCPAAALLEVNFQTLSEEKAQEAREIAAFQWTTRELSIRGRKNFTEKYYLVPEKLAREGAIPQGIPPVKTEKLRKAQAKRQEEGELLLQAQAQGKILIRVKEETLDAERQALYHRMSKLAEVTSKEPMSPDNITKRMSANRLLLSLKTLEARKTVTTEIHIGIPVPKVSLNQFQEQYQGERTVGWVEQEFWLECQENGKNPPKTKEDREPTAHTWNQTPTKN